MRTILRAALAAVLLLTASPAVADSPTRDSYGRCRWTYAEYFGTSGAEGVWGHLYTATVVYSETEPAANPVTATVTCSLRGVPYENGPFSFTGTGVVAGITAPFRMYPDDSSVIEVCTHVAYDNGETDESCHELTTTQVPPQQVIDVLGDALTAFDSVVCPLLGTLAPGIPGVVDVAPEGDVQVLGEWVWECPPYATEPTPPDHGTRQHVGDCRWARSETTGTGGADDVWGHLYTAMVVYSATDPAANPVSATVTCSLRGVEHEAGPYVFTGTGVVAGVTPAFRMFPDETSSPEVCTHVAYDNGETDESCHALTTTQIPPREVLDLLADAWDGSDGLVCPLIGTLAPGVPGVVDVSPEGDVDVLGEWVWDCPPHETEPAPADQGTRQHVGDCRWVSALQETHPPTGDGYWGHFFVGAVVYSATDPAANPVSATVTCSLRGVWMEGGPFTFTGTGVVAGVTLPFRYLDDLGFVETCTRVAYDNGEVDEHCTPWRTTQIPPQEVVDVIDDVLTAPDPVVCPLIGSLAPGEPGVVDVTPEGDVDVLGGWFWDCPPYRA